MRQTCADIENNAYNEQRRADLRALQALPLKDKIKMTQELINEAIAVYGEKHVYLSFSGGKDSTVLSHIARIQHPNLLHVFSDTSCEYPETIAFVEGLKETEINITIVTPTDRYGAAWTFDRVVCEYGYPLFSKAVANGIRTYRHAQSEETRQHSLDYMNRRFPQYLPFLEENISDLCCEKLKKTSVYKGYKQDKIEMRGDRAEMSDFPLYLNTVAGGLDRRDQTIGGFSFVVKIYALPVVEIIGQLLYLLGRYGFNAQFGDCL